MVFETDDISGLWGPSFGERSRPRGRNEPHPIWPKKIKWLVGVLGGEGKETIYISHSHW